MKKIINKNLNKNYYYILILVFLINLITGCEYTPISSENSILKLKIEIIEEHSHTSNLSISHNEQNIIKPNSLKSNENPTDYLIKFKDSLSKKEIKAMIPKNQGEIIKKLNDYTYKIKIINEKLLSNLKNNPHISYLEPDSFIYLQTIPNDSYYEQQWNLELLNFKETWNYYTGNSDIVVAVIDTGILPEHPDLKANLITGYDFIEDNKLALDNDPQASFSHGTHVAGIIAAQTNNNLGISGINWDISIMPIRVIGPGGIGNYSTLIKGINYAVDNGAHVINLSLAGLVSSQALKEAIENAVEKGVTIVAAAGNNGQSQLPYPACYPEVISVGAIDQNLERASFSNYGPDLDLVAPGVNILSTTGQINQDNIKYNYQTADGTSMAAPHVSALVALLYSIDITDPIQIKKLLKNTADQLGSTYYYGAGLINPNRALKINDSDNSFHNLQEKRKINIKARKKDEIIKTSGHLGHEIILELSAGTWSITVWNEELSKEIEIIVEAASILERRIRLNK